MRKADQITLSEPGTRQGSTSGVEGIKKKYEGRLLIDCAGSCPVFGVGRSSRASITCRDE